MFEVKPVDYIYWSKLLRGPHVSFSEVVSEDGLTNQQIIEKILKYNTSPIRNTSFDESKPVFYLYETHCREYTTNSKKLIRVFQ